MPESPYQDSVLGSQNTIRAPIPFVMDQQLDEFTDNPVVMGDDEQNKARSQMLCEMQKVNALATFINLGLILIDQLEALATNSSTLQPSVLADAVRCRHSEGGL